MPLRQWFADRGHPGWYSWFVIIGGCITTLIISLAFAKVMTDRAIRDSQRAMCDVVVVQDEAFRETPPASTSGKNLAKALHDLRITYGCPA